MTRQQRWSGWNRAARTIEGRCFINLACSPPSRQRRYGGQPSRGLPTEAHARVGKRERRLERETGFEPATSTLARSHSTTELFPPTEPRGSATLPAQPLSGSLKSTTAPRGQARQRVRIWLPTACREGT